MNKTLTINYQEYVGLSELPAADRELVELAARAAAGAYAPYSRFHVGAALRLADGTVVCGSNQENAAYPSGLCAERTALFAASASRPDVADYEALAIIGIDGQGRRCAAAPCGACRQVMDEYERRQRHPLRVVCYIDEACVRVFPNVGALLPFAFQF